jgi:hypothetical protein
MLRADLDIEVTDSCQLGQPLRIAATVFLPPPDELAEYPAVVSPPGGGYSRGYFDMHFPGHAGSIRDDNPDRFARMQARIPLGRVGDPEQDIVIAVVALASDELTYMSGQTLMLTGGA